MACAASALPKGRRPLMQLTPGLLAEAFVALRTCGAGRRECVVYFSGSLDRPGIVDRLHHPDHTADVGGYDVDDAWITMFFVELAAESRELRLQAHTHPGRAFHSARDDSMALGYFAGYLSLVIPWFAESGPTLDNAYLAVRRPDGTWGRANPEQELAWS